MLVLRCPRHPGYAGALKPGEADTLLAERGSSTCTDCWEVFRREHESKGPRHL